MRTCTCTQAGAGGGESWGLGTAKTPVPRLIRGRIPAHHTHMDVEFARDIEIEGLLGALRLYQAPSAGRHPGWPEGQPRLNIWHTGRLAANTRPACRAAPFAQQLLAGCPHKHPLFSLDSVFVPQSITGTLSKGGGPTSWSTAHPLRPPAAPPSSIPCGRQSARKAPLRPFGRAPMAPGSVASSTQSPRPASGRLRSATSSSYVDETLFGSPKAAPRKAGAGGSPAGKGSRPTSGAASKPAGPGRGSPGAAALVAGGSHDTLIISKSQLERMLQVCVVVHFCAVGRQCRAARATSPPDLESRSQSCNLLCVAPQASPILTAKQQEARRKEAEAKVEAELTKAKERRLLMAKVCWSAGSGGRFWRRQDPPS